MTSRRRFLRLAGLAGLATVVPAGALAGHVWVTAGRGNVGRVRFERPLAVPPVATPRRDAAGRTVHELALRAGTTELLPGRSTPTWGANGSYLGPTLRMRRGDVVAPRVRNDLPEATTLHWHGMELPAVADGGPHQLVPPGGTWQPSWRIDQPAATLWYHPHPHGSTRHHVHRGLAGMILVDDDRATGLLPERYGVDDIPLVLQDRTVTDDGGTDTDGIDFGGTDIVGLLGRDVFVNGTWGPVLRVTTQRIRLRVLNASNARVYDLALADGRPFHLVGSDQGLLPAPVETDHVRVSPGERVELVVAVRPGERLLLVSRPPELGANVLYDRLAGGDDEFHLLLLAADGQLAPSAPLPTRLPAAAPVAPPPPGRPDRRFDLGDFTINGRTMDLGRIDFAVPLGTTERWRIRNRQGVPHNFHVHNAAFTVSGATAPDMRGRKDTVFVAPGAEVTLLVSFGQHADPTRPYMFHCHLLAHEDAGMMGQYVVVAPGTEDQVNPTNPIPHPHP
ncbi:multicopper oxidase family protein [Micromonospora psammae]|uniref:multicopper oxidase family protein n=1 Tax=Micromonospora sp. CPCC 205556 TaxID=3122398 RepID=UPI002FEE7310